MIDLRQGDCLEVMKDIADKSVDMILCDLPYGTTKCKWDKIIQFEPLWEQYKRVIKDNSAIVLFAKEPFTSLLICSNIKNFKYRWNWIKDKHANFATAKYQPLNYTEDICVFNKHNYYPIMVVGNKNHGVGKGIRKKNNVTGANTQFVSNKTDGLKYPRNYLFFNRVYKPIHPTEKPVALLEYLIKTYTNENETVLDNCMGSGSTGVACVNTNRNFIGIELDENYFNIAKERIEKELK